MISVPNGFVFLSGLPKPMILKGSTPNGLGVGSVVTNGIHDTGIEDTQFREGILLLVDIFLELAVKLNMCTQPGRYLVMMKCLI